MSRSIHDLNAAQQEAIYRKYGTGNRNGINPVVEATLHEINSDPANLHRRPPPPPPHTQSNEQRVEMPTAAELANSRRLMRQQVKLNVGGENFHTTFSTLLKCEYFQRLLPTRVDKTVTVYALDEFIDRDPRIFRTILNYLRSDGIDIHEHDRKILLCEAQFFGIDKLMKRLQRQPLEDGYVITGRKHPLDVPILEYTDIPTQTNMISHNQISISIKGAKWHPSGRHYCRFIFIPSDPNIQYSLRIGGEGFFASRYSAEHPDLRLSLSNTDPLIEKERSVRYQESRARYDIMDEEKQKISSGAYTKGIIPSKGIVSLLMCIDVEGRYLRVYNTELKTSAFVRDIHNVEPMAWRPFWNIYAERPGPFKLHVDIFKIEPRQFEHVFRRHQIPIKE